MLGTLLGIQVMSGLRLLIRALSWWASVGLELAYTSKGGAERRD